MMKRKMTKLFTSLTLLLFAVFSISFTTFAEDETPEQIDYYVGFSYDDHEPNSRNKMTPVDTDSDGAIDYYVLENKTLSSSMDFCVVSSKKDVYYASDETYMKVTDADSFKYNIYFDPNNIYDKDRVSNTELYESNCHISYDYYIPGSYTLTINDQVNTNFKYNHYVTSYDAYILPEVDLKKDDVITIVDNNSTLDPKLSYQKTVDNDGKCRLVFTPTVVRNSNEYRFDKDGNYGTGDDYTENIYLKDVEYYYIVFEQEHIFESGTDIVSFEYNDTTIKGYRLLKDETAPLANVFKSNKFFNPTKDNKTEYCIYSYSYIYNEYKLIDDDNDKDTDVSEIKISDVKWYSITFTYAQERKYSTTAKSEETDFGGYYIIGEFNNFGFNNDGTIADLDKYQLEKVEAPENEDDKTYYEEDKTQYLISNFIITKSDLYKFEDGYEFYISNGKTKSNKIVIKTPGTYDILYSTDMTYNGASYKYIRTEDSDEILSHYDINSMEDFLSFIDAWNLDSETSKYVIYNLNTDLDFKNIDLTMITVFNGTLNGNNHILKNITLVNDNGHESIGLFKLVTKCATIRDLKIENINIDAEDSSYVGFIAKNYGLLENITIDGYVRGDKYVGGLVGYNSNYQNDSDSSADSSIKIGYANLVNIHTNVTVYGKVIVGGITGFNGGKIISSLNEGKINNKYYSSSVTVINVGGVAGYSTGEIVDTQNVAVVGYHSIGSNIGGLVGLCNGEIYFSNNEAVVNGKQYVGGIVGYFGKATTDKNNTTVGITNPGAYVDSVVNGNNDETSFTEEADVSSHVIIYCYNSGDVHSTSYSGGIVGYNNSAQLSVKNSAAEASIYSDSGSYAGGIAAYTNGGDIISCIFYGYVEANGSINKYVGGVTGYNNAKIEGCYVSATLNGSEYVGGIAGYVTSTGSILSTYTNTYMITKTSANYNGNIAGYIDGIDSASATYGSRVKYNFYLGSGLNDYSGINGVNYGRASHYAAQRINYSNVKTTNVLDLIAEYNTKFGLIDEDEDTYFFANQITSTLPKLVNFTILDELDDDKFDDDTNSYEAYEFYFNKHKETFEAISEVSSKLMVRFVFKEWNLDLKDNEYDNYKVTDIKLVDVNTLNSSFNYPELQLFDYKKDNEYYTCRDKALYKVSWSYIELLLCNQTIYANYTEIFNSYYDEKTNLFIEAEFVENDAIVVNKVDGKYSINVSNSDVDRVLEKISIKIKVDNPERCYVLVNGNKIIPTVYGQSISFDLASSNDTFEIVEGPFTFTMLPDGIKALIFVVPFFIILITLIVISNIKTRKKDKKKALENNDEEVKEENEVVEETKTEE